MVFKVETMNGCSEAVSNMETANNGITIHGWEVKREAPQFGEYGFEEDGLNEVIS